MTHTNTTSRRTFLQAGAAGALLIGFDIPAFAQAQKPAANQGPQLSPSAYLKIDTKGVVTLQLPRAEMGQGIYTAIPMMIAEELDINAADIVIEIPNGEPKKFAPISQNTGGSSSARTTFLPVRRAAASGRFMLITAAAQRWGVDVASCRTAEATVFHDASNRSARYADLVAGASKIPLPEKVDLKSPENFRVIGKPTKRLDAPGKVTGTTVYGIDVRLPGMKVATLAHSPVIGGRVKHYDEAAALAQPGVHQVLNLGDAAVVIADHMWAAKRGLAALKVEWDDGEHKTLNQSQIVQDIAAAAQKPGVIAGEAGDVDAAMAQAVRTMSATYEQPFLAHATMEPVNCTAQVTPTSCEVWIGTQSPETVKNAVIAATGLSSEAVTVHVYTVGGGFGRRLEADMVERAIQVAKLTDGPVKLVWSREEDIQHDRFRPYYLDQLSAGLDAAGKPIAWTHRVAGSSIIARLFPKGFKGVDNDAVEGAVETPYHFENKRVDFVRQESPVITSWWRGVGPLHNVFVVESFIDELAASAKIDPVEYRKALIQDPRTMAVLELAASKADWGKPLPAGHGRGISLLNVWGTRLAQVAEVEVLGNGQVKVNRVVAAVDCGQAINPLAVRAQMEGGIVFGVTAALYGEITIKNGRVEQSNFTDYRMLRINDAPRIETHIIENNEAPGGIGEPPTAGAAAAVANAVFAATGRRIRKLPIAKSLVTMASAGASQTGKSAT